MIETSVPPMGGPDSVVVAEVIAGAVYENVEVAVVVCSDTETFTRFPAL